MPDSRGTIVVVEDDAGLSQALARLLRAANYRVMSFDSAEALLASQCIGEAPCISGTACLVIDVRLPGISGFDLYHRLATFGPLPPTIVMTAHDDNGVRQRARDIRASAYLAKPFPGQFLLDAIERVTNG